MISSPPSTSAAEARDHHAVVTSAALGQRTRHPGRHHATAGFVLVLALAVSACAAPRATTVVASPIASEQPTATATPADARDTDTQGSAPGVVPAPANTDGRLVTPTNTSSAAGSATADATSAPRPEPLPLRGAPLASRFVDDPSLALQVSRRVKTGVLPKSVATSPDGRTLWVCNFGYEGRKNVYVYDSATMARVGLVEFRGNAVEVAFASDGRHAYVSNFARGVIAVVDTTSFEVLREIEVGVHPKVIVPARDGRVFVANWTSGTVSVVDPDRGRVVARLDGGKRPRGMAITREGTLVVDAMWDHELRTFSARTLDAVHAHADSKVHETHTSRSTKPRRGASLPKTPPDARLTTCRFPRHTIVDHEDTVFVTCSGEDVLRWHAASDWRVLGEVSVGDNPRSFALTDDGRYAAVANFDASSVTIVDLVDGRTHTTAIPGTDRLVGLAVAKGETLRVFVTSWGNNELVELTLVE